MTAGRIVPRKRSILHARRLGGLVVRELDREVAATIARRPHACQSVAAAVHGPHACHHGASK